MRNDARRTEKLPPQTSTADTARARLNCSSPLAGTTVAAAVALTCAALFGPVSAQAQAPTPARPNILVIFGDDIGQSNISAYTHGLMGYKTPNIDRIAREGTMFTDYYAENSCTAGRSSFITGQTPKRTGLSKVGTPSQEPASFTIDQIARDVEAKIKANAAKAAPK
jgi:Sulfatase